MIHCKRAFRVPERIISKIFHLNLRVVPLSLRGWGGYFSLPPPCHKRPRIGRCIINTHNKQDISVRQVLSSRRNITCKKYYVIKYLLNIWDVSLLGLFFVFIYILNSQISFSIFALCWKIQQHYATNRFVEKGSIEK